MDFESGAGHGGREKVCAGDANFGTLRSGENET